MNLESCRTFCYIVKYRSITKAAEYLYITQPAVSRSIQQLENEIGCILFSRTQKGIKLTQEGEVLYKYLSQAFDFISTAEMKINSMKNLTSGEIRIGVSDTLCKYYLVPYLKLFNTLHPPIKLHVVCPTTPNIINLLKSGKIDFGLINLPYDDNALNFRKIMSIQDCFVVGNKLKHLSSQYRSINEISNYPLILLEKNSNSRLFIDKYFEANSISISPDFELGNIDLLIQFAKFDFGIACVIRNFIEDELERGTLHEINLIQKIPQRSIGVAWLKDMPLSYASKELISMLEYNETYDI